MKQQNKLFLSSMPVNGNVEIGDNPIVIMGRPRSGKSMVLSILAQLYRGDQEQDIVESLHLDGQASLQWQGKKNSIDANKRKYSLCRVVPESNMMYGLFTALSSYQGARFPISGLLEKKISEGAYNKDASFMQALAIAVDAIPKKTPIEDVNNVDMGSLGRLQYAFFDNWGNYLDEQLRVRKLIANPKIEQDRLHLVWLAELINATKTTPTNTQFRQHIWGLPLYSSHETLPFWDSHACDYSENIDDIREDFEDLQRLYNAKWFMVNLLPKERENFMKAIDAGYSQEKHEALIAEIAEIKAFVDGQDPRHALVANSYSGRCPHCDDWISFHDETFITKASMDEFTAKLREDMGGSLFGWRDNILGAKERIVEYSADLDVLEEHKRCLERCEETTGLPYKELIERFNSSQESNNEVQAQIAKLERKIAWWEKWHKVIDAEADILAYRAARSLVDDMAYKILADYYQEFRDTSSVGGVETDEIVEYFIDGCEYKGLLDSRSKDAIETFAAIKSYTSWPEDFPLFIDLTSIDSSSAVLQFSRLFFHVAQSRSNSAPKIMAIDTEHPIEAAQLLRENAGCEIDIYLVSGGEIHKHG